MTAFDWAAAAPGAEPPAEVFCSSRDIATARVGTLQILLAKAGVGLDASALLTAIAGELANNCFDHNLGAWHDVPGCWLEHDVVGNAVRLIVADRGQGFLGSLRRVRPKLANHRDALLAGFTEHVSGRTPEQRGRGLPFVVEALATLPGTVFRLQTGDARLTFTSPVSLADLPTFVAAAERLIPGTYAELTYPNAVGTIPAP